jgi:hypothetical protein
LTSSRVDVLTIHEWTAEDGARKTVRVTGTDGAIAVHAGDEPGVELPVLALERVMTRYGKALADGVELDGPRLDLAGGRALHLIRHLARYDVIARDFVVWTTPEREPLAELAVAISGALLHLARAAGEPIFAPGFDSGGR